MLRCSLSKISASNKILKCREVALNDNFIFSAISPTDNSSPGSFFSDLRISSRLLLANAFNSFSRFFMRPT